MLDGKRIFDLEKYLQGFNPNIKLPVDISNWPEAKHIDLAYLKTICKGDPGSSGANSYLYIGFSEDEIGTDFSLTPASNRLYISFLVSSIIIPNPQFSNFNTWIKYIGGDGDVYDHWVLRTGAGTDIQFGYGYLYNWYAINDVRGLAPEGYSVPTAEDYYNLGVYLGGYSTAGKKLKSVRTQPDDHPRWDTPEFGASVGTDEVKFNLLPSGARNAQHGFTGLGESISLYTANEFDITNSFAYFASKYGDSFDEGSGSKKDGASIRCIKDDLVGYDTDGDEGTVTDIDGNVYLTKRIGNKVWTLSNLVTKRYRNGDNIPNITDDGDWQALVTGGYCAYNNDESNVFIVGVESHNIYSKNIVEIASDTIDASIEDLGGGKKKLTLEVKQILSSDLEVKLPYEDDNITVGKFVYYDYNDGLLKLASNAQIVYPLLGVVIHTEDYVATVRRRGLVSDFLGLVKGATYYLGTNGNIIDTLPTNNKIIILVGFAKTSSTLDIEIDDKNIITN